MFCIAFLVRTYICAPIVGFLAPRVIDNRFHGFARCAAMTALNVSIASPITGGAVALLFTDTDDFLHTYVAALSATMPMAMFASLFIVGPIVKLVFNNLISPAGGLKMLKHFEQHAMSIARLFGM